MLVDWRRLRFSQKELDFLESAPVLVRAGQRSFYSTILSSDRMFFRFDPGCLEAVTERGRAALTLVEQRLEDSVPEVHYWSKGDILIIDNWTIMHGRASVNQGSGRRLGRILIDA
ncbi:TauD/TfdA family dioxygenase [Kiloniella laminariae]|uniref:TauD/TfdA family dioxygenase n=1 Tax=Kiloniella laminariae TaxID=454162 RepID=UPI00035E821E